MPRPKKVGEIDTEHGAIVVKEIKPAKGKHDETKIDFVKRQSAYSPFKTGKFAKDLPALCDLCRLGKKQNCSWHGPMRAL